MNLKQILADGKFHPELVSTPALNIIEDAFEKNEQYTEAGLCLHELYIRSALETTTPPLITNAPQTGCLGAIVSLFWHQKRRGGGE